MSFPLHILKALVHAAAAGAISRQAHLHNPEFFFDFWQRGIYILLLLRPRIDTKVFSVRSYSAEEWKKEGIINKGGKKGETVAVPRSDLWLPSFSLSLSLSLSSYTMLHFFFADFDFFSPCYLFLYS